MRENGGNNNNINKLNYPGPGARRPLLQDDASGNSARPSHDNSYAGSFFEQVAEGIYTQDRQKMKREVVRYFSFAWAVVTW